MYEFVEAETDPGSNSDLVEENAVGKLKSPM